MSDQPSAPQPPVPPQPPAAAFPPEPPQPSTPRPRQKGSGLGVAALVLGIIAFVLAWIPFVSYVAAVIAGIGLVLGIVGLFLRNRSRGLVIAGAVVSAVALLAAILMSSLYAAAFSSAVKAVGDDSSHSSGSSAPSKAGSSAAPSTGADDDSDSDDAAKTVPLGTTAKTDHFQLTVTKVEPGVDKLGDTVGDTFLGEKAQGQFVLVHLTVKNVDTDPAYFTSSDVDLRDAAGRTFSADDTASLYLPDNSTLFEQINPGNTLKGIAVFDIPKDAKPTELDYSGGLLGGDDAVLALK